MDALAAHRDPSIPAATNLANASPRPRGIAWVRPTELPTVVGSAWVGRGIDLQSDLVRRSRRAPFKAARAGRRTSRTAMTISKSAEPTATSIQEREL